MNARIDEGDFAGDANLNGLAAVLAGSEEAFNLELVEKCESWYQWMIGETWSHVVTGGHIQRVAYPLVGTILFLSKTLLADTKIQWYSTIQNALARG